MSPVSNSLMKIVLGDRRIRRAKRRHHWTAPLCRKTLATENLPFVRVCTSADSTAFLRLHCLPASYSMHQFSWTLESCHEKPPAHSPPYEPKESPFQPTIPNPDPFFRCPYSSSARVKLKVGNWVRQKLKAIYRKFNGSPVLFGRRGWHNMPGRLYSSGFFLPANSRSHYFEKTACVRSWGRGH